MAAQTDGIPCHVKGCDQTATETCERCGQWCCPAHVRHLTIERREERSAQRARLDALARIPTRTETYTLCLRCSTKPVQRRLSSG